MTIYEAYVSDKEAHIDHNVSLAVLETKRDKQLYEDEDYDALFAGTDFTDNDIFFYVYKEDIPKANRGVIKPGDVYDFLTILTCKKLGG